MSDIFRYFDNFTILDQFPQKNMFTIFARRCKNLEKLSKAGVKIIVQDPASCIAPYMPETAIKTGHVTSILNEEMLQGFIKRSVA